MITETMNSDSDLLDDIFEPATAIEKASRFQPKPRITKKKIIPKSSKSAVSEGPSSNPKFPDAAVSKRPVEGSSGSSGGHLDVHNPEENFEFSISNNVLDKVSQFGIGEPEQRSDVSCSLESLDGHNKNFPTSDLVGYLSHQPIMHAETRNSDSDLLDDIFASATTIEKASRFQPKPRITKKKIIPKSSKSAVSEGPSSNPKFPDAAESKKPVEGSSGSSSGHLDVHNPEEEIEFSISNIVLDKDPQFGVGEREPEQCTVVSCSLESLDGYKKDFSVSGVAGPTSTSNLDLSNFEPISVSSEHEECQSSLVNKGFAANIEASDLSLRYVHLQTDSAEVGKKLATMRSFVEEPLDDLFLQSDQPAGADSVSSEHEVSQSSLVINGYAANIEASDLSSRHTEVGNEPTTADSSAEHLDDLFLQSDQSAVNKAYLEIPDDEADRRKLAIRDLIRLAGFKERIASKEAASLKNSFANQSGDQEEDPDADDEDREIKGEVPKLNYHSYMKRPQQIRWSNTETEFFYQAIRQFGTDFAMIQVLFPNRSREQVKAKFKNEQRKRPLQIADAIFRRSKDHSHFEKVIQHLKTAAEQSAKCDPSTVSKDEADENEEERSATNTKDEQEVNYF